MPPIRKKYIAALLILTSAVLCGIVAGVVVITIRDLPQIRSLETFQPSAVSRIYSADGILLSKLFSENRDPVELNSIPDHLKTAILTTEDRHFYHHSGVDIKGILRAIIKNVTAGRYVEGASTITQQLTKTLFLTPRKTLGRKFKEIILSLQLEKRYTKDEILKLYLNQIYLGSGTYGVESAARTYFSKSVQALTLSQCALLAGLPKAPSRYSPLLNPQLAKKRRDIVLKQMFTTGAISPKAYQSALAEPVTPGKNQLVAKAPYFIRYLKPILEAKIGASKLFRSGITVYTSIDYKLQTAAQQIIEKAKQTKTSIASQGKASPLSYRGSIVVLDISTGAILAMSDDGAPDNNLPNQETVKSFIPESAFYPIIYACAIEKGSNQICLIKNATAMDKNSRPHKKERDQKSSTINNSRYTLRRALISGKIEPTVQLAQKIGAPAINQFAHKVGLQDNLANDFSLFEDNAPISLLNLVAAYAAFSNRGFYIKPFAINKVEDRWARTIWQPKPVEQVVMSRSTAAIVTDMLQAAANKNDNRAVRNVPGPVAAISGTTQNGSAALFIGYSPQIAVAVFFRKDPAPNPDSSPSAVAAARSAWIDIMTLALKNKTQTYFDLPDDIISRRIDSTTGQILPKNDHHGIPILFRKSTIPSPGPQ